MKSSRFLFLAFAAAPLAAESVQCPVSADTWVAMHRWEERGGARREALATHGQDPVLHVRGRESFALLAFDLGPAKGMTVSRATLRIHRAPAAVPVHTIGLSTISGKGPWVEESASFFHPRGAADPWSYPGSDLIDVTFAQGGSLYSYERAREAGDGWWEVNVPPALVHALASGDQFGLMLCDEKGQTQTRHAFASKESGRPPVLVVEGERTDRTAPGAVRKLPAGAPATRQGTVTVAFGGAGEDAVYELRYSPSPITARNFEQATAAPRWAQDPLAPKGHPLASSNARRDVVTAVVEGLKPGGLYYFAARARDEAGNLGPVSPLGGYRAYWRTFPSLPPAPAAPSSAASTQPAQVWAVPELLKVHPQTGALLEQSDFPHHRTSNSVWDASSSTVRLTGARNEFVAFQLAIESPRPATGIEVRVSRPLFGGSKLPAVFRDTGAIQLYREWFVPDEGKAWYADALIPLAAPLDLPAKDNGVAGQTVQPVFVDVYIPHDARPGAHWGELEVRGGGLDRRIKLRVEVLPIRLPDQLGFVVDLNCYSGVDSGYDVRRGTPEYRKLEQAYHRLAHLHRTNLDVLGYSHNGTTVPDHAPPLTGEGGSTRVADWSGWEAHFGPLLDGSAFTDLPRASAPIQAMYLPFFENWPGDLRRHYQFDDPTVPKTEAEYNQIVTRHALRAAPIEECFSPEYEARFQAVAADFAAHLLQRGYTRTWFTVYLNNKYYWKRPSQGGRGISWWLLDEPNHRDDVRAISYFGMLLKKGLASHPKAPILFRTDISRVEWIRDMLAGQIDLNCISSRFISKNRYLVQDRHRFGRTYWNYASTNHPRTTNVGMRAWCWRVWLNGGDGLLPWNAVRGHRVWEQAEPLTVFYPASRFGKMEPYASLRLKAYRRGQQDMEYLGLLAKAKGWDRDAVTEAVAKGLDLSGETRMAYEEDAGTLRFEKIRDADLEGMRLRVARALGGGR